MSQIQEFHQQAMDLAQMAQVGKLRGNLAQAEQATGQACEKERLAAELLASNSEYTQLLSVFL